MFDLVHFSNLLKMFLSLKMLSIRCNIQHVILVDASVNCFEYILSELTQQLIVMMVNYNSEHREFCKNRTVFEKDRF